MIRRTALVLTACALSFPAGIVHGIAGGENSSYGPAIVYLVSAPEKTATCSGTLVSERWLLTSAHCLVDSLEHKRINVRVAVAVEDDGGATLICLSTPGRDRSVGNPPCGQYYEDAVGVIHPDFNPGLREPDDEDDLALIRLEPARDWYGGVSTIPTNPYALLSAATPRDNDTISIHGSSFTDGDRDMCTSWTDSACPRWDRTQGHFSVDDVDDEDIEYDANADFSTCGGDSGSPVTFFDSEKNTIVIGVHTERRRGGNRGACGDSGSKLQATRINQEKLGWIRTTMGVPCYTTVEAPGTYRCFGPPPPPVTVPDLTGQTCGDALGTLRDIGLRGVCLPNEGGYKVYDQTPLGGDSAKEGDTVYLQVHDPSGPQEPLGPAVPLKEQSDTTGRREEVND